MNRLPFDVADYVPAMVLVLDANGTVTAANRRSRERFGEIAGRSLDELHAAAPEVTWDVRVVGGGAYRVASAVDVPASAERLESLSHALFHVMPDPVFLKDGAGHWLEANQAALDLFHVTAQEACGRSDTELAARGGFLQEAFAYCARSDEAAWRQGTVSRGLEIIPQPEGRARTFDVYKIPLFHPDGRRRNMVVLGREVTETRRAEDALRASEAQLRRIVETVPEAIAMFDAAGELTFMNTAAERILGVPRDRVLRRRFEATPWLARALDGRLLPPEEQPIRRVQRTGEALFGVEVAVLRADGEARVVSLNAAPLEAPAGGVVVAAQDVSRRAELDRKKRDFLQVASHELRTPILPLRLLLDASLESVAQGRPVEAPALERMSRQVRRLTRLIDQLLSVARLERAAAWSERRLVDLRGLIAAAAEDVRLLAPAREIRFRLPDAPAIVKADADALSRVATNLLDNALKYSDGPIAVSVVLEPASVRVEVVDRGPGLSPAEREGLFTRFYRVQSDQTVRQPGLGLGLFICREIVEAHGGTVGYATEPGKGSTFYFTLPRADVAAR